jgi:hypothetical protein
MLRLKIRGKNRSIDLRDSDFITAGGEGKIYDYGSHVCKIYIDPSKMIPDAKFSELQMLTRPNIIKPLDILTDANNAPVGFIMSKVFGEPLCKFFISDFINSYGASEKHLHEFIKIIQETISSIHLARCLMVDGNELNYIVSKKLDNVYFIDVNSYQTPHFPATAIMPTIKDYHSNNFSELTDWYSFAIVSCWLLVGVHPFKGKHPKYKKKGIENTIDRMKDNISIFNSDVVIPSTARSLNCIPSNYRSWYVDMFEKGSRTGPPSLLGKIMMTPVYTSIIKSTGNFDMIKLKEFRNEILSYKKYFGKEIVLLKSDDSSSPNYYMFDDRRISRPNSSNVTQIENDKMLLTPADLIPILIMRSRYQNDCHDILELHSINPDYKISESKVCENSFILENKLYIKFNDRFEEIAFSELSKNRIVPILHTYWNILPKSSRTLDGFLIQEGLDKIYIYIPVPSKHWCLIKQIRELEGYKIIDGKYENGVCMIIGKKGYTYDKIVLRISEDGTYDCRIINDISNDSINFVVLDNGVCASFMDDHTLELFHNKPNLSDIKSITDTGIDSSMKLWKDGVRLLFSKKNNLFIIKLKRI